MPQRTPDQKRAMKPWLCLHTERNWNALFSTEYGGVAYRDLFADTNMRVGLLKDHDELPLTWMMATQALVPHLRPILLTEQEWSEVNRLKTVVTLEIEWPGRSGFYYHYLHLTKSGASKKSQSHPITSHDVNCFSVEPSEWSIVASEYDPPLGRYRGYRGYSSTLSGQLHPGRYRFIVKRNPSQHHWYEMFRSFGIELSLEFCEFRPWPELVRAAQYPPEITELAAHSLKSH